ncbi:uncharacterized protein LOC114933323 [Nylanderia fulva]|uniref:uncharacterized protein LOC114933323 n=1 Tax=Nylanderia fulva TaxID=613905 RepID=UPI0010FB910C|nr:uncharacterized protein LOC114933323 [Nylanderia fulva]
MAVRHRVLWLIVTLYYIATTAHCTLLNINDAESCDLLCKQCNTSAVFTDDRCECNLSDNNDKGAECIQRIQREIEAIDLNILSEDSTDEERGVRSILKSRHRLRMEEAGSRPAISDAEIPIIGMIHPALSYSANIYDAASPVVGSIIHHPYRHGSHHRLHKTDSLPVLLHNLFSHHRWSPGHRPVHYGRNSNDKNPVLISQPYENDGSSTASKEFSTAQSNTDKPVDQNVAANIPRLFKPTYHSITPYFFDANAMYEPIQYPPFNIPYTSYHNPLMEVLHPITEEYIVQPGYIPQYVHGISDPLITAPNPNSYCTNNANAEQKDEVSTDKTVYSNNKVKQSNDVNNIINAEKNENN